MIRVGTVSGTWSHKICLRSCAVAIMVCTGTGFLPSPSFHTGGICNTQEENRFLECTVISLVTWKHNKECF